MQHAIRQDAYACDKKVILEKLQLVAVRLLAEHI
jgi:hypothetical protein